MALAGRLRHTLVIERPTLTEDRSDRDPPSTSWADVATVKGWLQPLTLQEQSQLSGAGSVTASHRLYVLPTDVRESDVIRLVPDDGRRYEVVAVIDAAGKGQHYQVDLVARTAGGA